MLGASWALYREVLGRLGRRPPRWQGMDDLRVAIEPVGRLRVVTVTDGGFGAGAARAARLFGFDSVVYVPATASPERLASLAREGAEVKAVGTTWDDAMAAAATETGDEVVLLSESSWEGFDEIPQWVTEGYATVFEEVTDELETRGRLAPDAVLVPLGIGALASAGAAWFRTERFSPDLWLAGVEPAGAACWTASLSAGERVTLPGPGVTVAEGLARGLPSPLAWPVVAGALDAVVAVDDPRVLEAAERLAAHGVLASPTGAVAFAGLLEALESTATRTAAAMPLGPSSPRVLVVVTEGVARPDGEALGGRLADRRASRASRRGARTGWAGGVPHRDGLRAGRRCREPGRGRDGSSRSRVDRRTIRVIVHIDAADQLDRLGCSGHGSGQTPGRGLLAGSAHPGAGPRPPGARRRDRGSGHGGPARAGSPGGPGAAARLRGASRRRGGHRRALGQPLRAGEPHHGRARAGRPG